MHLNGGNLEDKDILSDVIKDNTITKTITGGCRTVISNNTRDHK